MEKRLEALRQRKAQLKEMDRVHRDTVEDYISTRYGLPTKISLYNVTLTYEDQEHTFYPWASDNEMSSACSVDTESLTDEELLAYLRGRQARTALFITIRDELKGLI